MIIHTQDRRYWIAEGQPGFDEPGPAGSGLPVWVLSEARSRQGGLVPGMTSIFKYSLISCLSSAPLTNVIRFRLANCSLVRPNHDVVTRTPVVA